ncbi:acyl-CoA dehydrogenase family protein [Streptomyces griseorubiginosus]|uniref:acyl-CoA dehydrogenase family protein n=1 Tax=Streptomyces griseorubiginosus TaxID=67304 RepID=UPI0036ACA753
MTLVFTEEQNALRSAVRKFTGDRFSSERVRALMETPDGHDPDTWELMARQLGLQGLLVPEELGGSGASLVELAIVCEELGYGLVCSPFLGTAGLATTVLLACGDQAARRDLLPGIADGTTIATVALTEEPSAATPRGTGLTATRTAEGHVLDGVCSFVPDGHIADLVLVVAGTASGAGVFAVDRNATGLVRDRLTTLDLTRKQARLGFTATPARLVGTPESAGAALEDALDTIRVLIAAEQVGGAQRCLDMSVEYARTRCQFGRTIGSFQAVKHRCADMLVAVESARSAVHHAMETAADRSDALRLAAPMAVTLASEAYQYCARQNIQLHGGIGCTWEHDAHLHYRRAHTGAVLIGDGRHHRTLLATRLGM